MPTESFLGQMLENLLLTDLFGVLGFSVPPDGLRVVDSFLGIDDSITCV